MANLLLVILTRTVFCTIALQVLIWIGDSIVPIPTMFTKHVAEVQRPQFTTEEVEILALNIYHESRGLSGKDNIGWRSVAAVVFNRLEDKRFPKTIRDIVIQKDERKGTCAFSWYCDGISDTPRNASLYRKIYSEVEKYLTEYREGTWVDPTRGAHSYHANTVGPNKYFKKLNMVLAVIDGKFAHYFYRDS